jgi:hypothetical protein
MVSGGLRKGAGRKARPDPKSDPLWIGQRSKEDIAFIKKWLSPDDRFQVLMAAANNACTLTGGILPPEKPLSTSKQLPRSRKLSKPATRR